MCVRALHVTPQQVGQRGFTLVWLRLSSGSFELNPFFEVGTLVNISFTELFWRFRGPSLQSW